MSTHVSEFPINTILAWIINDYHEQGNITITNLLLPLGHISNSLSLAPALSQTALMSRPPGVANVGSIEKGDQELYGCFSPHVGDSSSSLSASSPVLSTTEGESVVVLQAPVLQAMPELRELCLSPTSPLFVEHLEVDSSMTSCAGHVSPLSSKQLKVHESIMSVDPMVDDVVSMVPLAEDVDAAGVLMLAP